MSNHLMNEIDEQGTRLKAMYTRQLEASRWTVRLIWVLCRPMCGLLDDVCVLYYVIIVKMVKVIIGYTSIYLTDSRIE